MNILRRLRLWIRWGRFDSDMREELEFHRAAIQRALEAQGASRADAVRESRRRMGNGTLACEDARQVWIAQGLDGVRHDVRYALRTFRRDWVFSIAALLTLALGIGANSAIVSIVDAAVLRPLPYTRPDRLVHVRLHNRINGRQTDGMTPRDFLEWRTRNRVFAHLAMTAGALLTLEDGQPERLFASAVTSGFFETLGVRPLHGRSFSENDEEPGADRIVILSYGFWQARFGGSPHAIGRSLVFDDGKYTIVGILPKTFSYPAGREQCSLFIPMVFDQSDRQSGVVQSMGGSVVARLRDDVSVAQAQAAMTELQSALDRQHVSMNKGYSVVQLQPLLDMYVAFARRWMLALLGAVACVLLIACANVANLFIVRAMARARELTVRGALGASRGRIARQLVVETLTLSMLGGLGGLALGRLTLRLLRASMPTAIPRYLSITLDARVVAIMAVIVTVTGLVCSSAPAWIASRIDLVAGLKQGDSSTATASRRYQGLRFGLVWSEVALATLLLCGAGLLIASFARLITIDKGFDPAGVVTFDLTLRNAHGQTVQAASERAKAELNSILAAVRARGGIEASLNVTGSAPFEGGYTTVPFVRADETSPNEKSAAKELLLQRVSDGFLEMLRVPLLGGRFIKASDTESSTPVVVVNEAAAKAFWGGHNPIGDRLRINQGVYQVVGVAGDMRYVGPEYASRPQAFVPYRQSYAASSTLIVRAGGQQGVVPLVKAAVWSIDPALPITHVRTADEWFDLSIADQRFNMELLSLFALLAVVIAATGVYGVLAFAMNQRRREIGIRLALGAQPASVVAALVRAASAVIVAGILAGVAGSLLLSRTIQSFVFEISPRDPWVLGGVGVVIGLIALLAAWLPARRAAAVDPLTVLRAE